MIEHIALLSSIELTIFNQIIVHCIPPVMLQQLVCWENSFAQIQRSLTLWSASLIGMKIEHQASVATDDALQSAMCHGLLEHHPVKRHLILVVNERRRLG